MSSAVQLSERYNASAGSQAGFAYETIRVDILCGRHMPSKKLKVHDLAAQLGVSPGAVREALFRLVSERLVEAREQRGFAVTPVSVKELRDLADLRCEIEAIASRRSVERGGLEWESGLVAAQYRFRATSADLKEDDDVSVEFLSAHEAFHEALCAAAGNERLLALRAQLFQQYQRFRGFYSHFAGKHHFAGDHDRIVELALARKTDELVDAIVEHVSVTANRIIRAIESQNGP